MEPTGGSSTRFDVTSEADSSTSFLGQHPRSLQYREQVETALRAVIPLCKSA
jgi:hypothetical protein